MTEDRDDTGEETESGPGASVEEAGREGQRDLSQYKGDNNAMKALWTVSSVAVLFVIWNVFFASPATELSRIKIQIAGIEKELAALHSAELTYKGAHGAFTDDLAALDYTKKRVAVTVTVTKATGECYEAEARHADLRGAFLIDCTGKLSERFEEGGG